MARDQANIRVDIWNDEDFRQLTGPAQLLYLQLLSAASLTYVGVADWRPKRIASLSALLTPEDVEKAGEELSRGLYVVIDEETEEVLVRSFLRHDGLLKKPNITKAMLRNYDKVISFALKGVIVHELKRLAERFPEWLGFSVEGFPELLRKGSVNPSDLVAGRVQGTLAGGVRPLPTTNYLLPATGYGATVAETGDAIDGPESTTTEVALLTPKPDVEGAFAEAWKHWPKKDKRMASLEKFRIVARRMPLAELRDAVIRYGAAYAAATDKQFVPALVVWLNGERWTDELPTPSTHTRQAATVALVERYREQEQQHAEIGDGDDPGVRAGHRRA